MAHLLYIQASPRKTRSHSIAVVQEFLKTYREKNSGDKITTLDIFETNLPAFDGLAVEAKYTILHGQKHTPEELSAWKTVEDIIHQFKSADKYAMAVPMWNFGIPYRLKQYLDILVQPGYTFSFSPKEGYKGLVTGKPMFIAYARGGEYPPNTPGADLDFQKRYLETILGFIGFANIRSVIVEPTLAGTELAEKRQQAAIKTARGLALEF